MGRKIGRDNGGRVRTTCRNVRSQEVDGGRSYRPILNDIFSGCWINHDVFQNGWLKGNRRRKVIGLDCGVGGNI